MSVLKRLPQDGTYNKIGPIPKLSEMKPRDVYSFDLKSATDRWPLSVMYTLIEAM